jgi:AraC-like DNA-binding protein
MKPLFRKNLNTVHESIAVRRDYVPSFTIPWHYHPEYELLYIQKGSGTRFVGDSIQAYHDGDLVLVGENLPHYWSSDTTLTTETEAYVVHFLKDSLTQKFLELPELRKVSELLQSSVQGIVISGTTRDTVAELLKNLSVSTEALKISIFLQILHVIANGVNDLKKLSNDAFPVMYRNLDSRLQKVYDFVMANFNNNIDLKAVASVANMTPSSFCRYFKATTSKSFVEFLNEVRVNNASKLLIAGNKSVNEIAYMSGYNTISNFSKQFYKVAGMNPLLYKKMHSPQV